MHLWQHLVPEALKSNFFGLGTIDWVRFNLLVRGKLNDIAWKNYWAVACHHLWMWRNKHVHDNEFVRPLHTSRIITEYVMHYRQGTDILDRVISFDRRVVNVSWKPPPTGWVAINTDGAVKTTVGVVAACGGVIRDAEGRWLSGFAKRLFVSNAYLAELWGAYEGLKLAHSMGFVNIELRMDSMVLVKCLTNDGGGSFLGRNLLNKIKQQLLLFTNVHIVHSYREANKVADFLANIGCNMGDGFIVYSHPPVDAKLLVDADVLGVSTPRLVPV